MIKLFISGIPPSLNKYLNMHYFVRDKIKKQWHTIISCEILKQKCQMTYGKVNVKLTYYFKDKRRRDYDNYSGKLILDGIKGRLIEDDNYTVLTELTLRFGYDKTNPGVSIEIEKAGE